MIQQGWLYYIFVTSLFVPPSNLTLTNETLKKPYIKVEPKEEKKVEPKKEEQKKSKIPTGVLVNKNVNLALLLLSVVGLVFVRKRIN